MATVRFPQKFGLRKMTTPSGPPAEEIDKSAFDQWIRAGARDVFNLATTASADDVIASAQGYLAQAGAPPNVTGGDSTAGDDSASGDPAAMKRQVQLEDGRWVIQTLSRRAVESTTRDALKRKRDVNASLDAYARLIAGSAIKSSSTPQELARKGVRILSRAGAR